MGHELLDKINIDWIMHKTKENAEKINKPRGIRCLNVYADNWGKDRKDFTNL